MNPLEIVPAPFYPLFVPDKWRYKVFYGGRGGAKSVSVARAVAYLASKVKLDVLYAREFQNSIDDSSYRDLVQAIDDIGLMDEYDIGKTTIAHKRTDSVFRFMGLRHNLASIKSKSNFDLCIVEEAATVSEDAWATLDPTIRKPNSEIWVIFNPQEESNPTYQRFVKDPPPNAYVRKVNFDENPFFPEVLRKQKDHLAKVNPDAYQHIWLGEPSSTSDAQIFRSKYEINDFEVLPEWGEPYFGIDWGFSQDPTTLIKCYVYNDTLYIEYEAYGIGVEINDLPDMFSKVPQSSEFVARADNARPETIRYMQRHGYPRVVACNKWKGSVADGIERLRSFEKIIIHPRCINTAQEFRLYSYKQDKLSGVILPDIVDANNHCIDAIRYGLESFMKKNTPSFGIHGIGYR